MEYKFADWFGICAGEVKTVLGLYNDTKDLEALHTWAILPQSTYPLDLRASNIADTGGDIYGNISLRKAGSPACAGYAGLRLFDQWGGLSRAVPHPAMFRTLWYHPGAALRDPSRVHGNRYDPEVPPPDAYDIEDVSLRAEHAQQFGGASPRANLMEVKASENARAIAASRGLYTPQQ